MSAKSPASSASPASSMPSVSATSRALPGVRAVPLPPSAIDLLSAARRDLTEATRASGPLERYAAAHRAALHTAAAVLAVRTRPDSRRGVPRSAWVLLARVAPELAEWAQFFAAGARKRAAAEAGLRSAATRRESDDLLRDAETFLARAETAIGLPSQLPLPIAR